MVYIVMKICDFEYGCREVDRVFSTENEAKEYVESVQEDIVFWNGKTHKLYTIEEWEVE